MESCKLEIILHSAKDLFDVKIFGTMDPYALLCITRLDRSMTSDLYKTNVAKGAGPYPVWEYRMQFEVVSMNNSDILICQIKHDGTLFDRDIGEVIMPLSHLLAGNALGEKVSYPVKLDTGEVQGKIIL
ncbi:protein SRC2-like [Bidens hawaiensis]|uniref:protein SRC2-like n=1 Tax=Bidens hawaiensis TaxID=980011 RepID=UPI00404A13D4